MNKKMKKSVGKFVNKGILKKRNLIVTKYLKYLDREQDPMLYESGDLIRVSSLELIAYEIGQKKIGGAVAELGVYRGMFAKYINAFFPERKLYLFDTFEGFHEADISQEKKHGYSNAEQNFSKTSVKTVMEKMRYKENCVIKKGFFPETVKGLEEEFCFVSIDADLYEPIYRGLEYFYENLLEGGYIFVHDYNNKEYKGAKAAVQEFSKNRGISYFPLMDAGGTAVFLK